MSNFRTIMKVYPEFPLFSGVKFEFIHKDLNTSQLNSFNESLMSSLLSFFPSLPPSDSSRSSLCGWWRPTHVFTSFLRNTFLHIFPWLRSGPRHHSLPSTAFRSRTTAFLSGWPTIQATFNRRCWAVNQSVTIWANRSYLRLSECLWSVLPVYFPMGFFLQKQSVLCHDDVSQHLRT